MSDVCFPSSSSASHATVSEQLTTTPKATRQRPSLKRIKSCLKHSCPFDSVSSSPTGSGTPERPSTPRKCVAFCSEEEAEVWVADEWDRTPADPARKLSYGDLLELKAIQNSLPRAAQPPDPLARRPQPRLLSRCAVGLLPLLPEVEAPGVAKPTATPNSTPVSSAASSRSTSANSSRDPSPTRFAPSPYPKPLSQTSSSYTQNTAFSPPSAPTTFAPSPFASRLGRPQRSFTFLPLLESSTTSPTNATPPPPAAPEPTTFAEFERLLEQELGIAAAAQEKEVEEEEGKPESLDDDDHDHESEPEHGGDELSLTSSPSSVFSTPDMAPKRTLTSPPSPPIADDKPMSYTRSHGSTQFIATRGRSSQRSALSDSLTSDSDGDDDTAVESDPDHHDNLSISQSGWKAKLALSGGQVDAEEEPSQKVALRRPMPRMAFVPLN